MHDSDEEEGFIPSHLEVKNKQTPRAPLNQNKPIYYPNQRVHYRFGGAFIKKQHPRALTTPLTLPEDSVTIPPSINKDRPTSFQHPYRMYCVGETFTLAYNRNGENPLINQKQYMKNEVSLIGFEDHSSPSLKDLKSFEIEEQIQGDQLCFDSRFESGNLHCAFRRRGTQDYHLFMGNDTNTLGYNQWFYFAVTNIHPRTTYTFHIVNYRKPLHFFAHGQRVALFSLKQSQLGRPGWRRTGNKYSLQQSNIRSSPERQHFVLSFTITFPHPHDYVLLASSIPYSYSKLLNDLSLLKEEAISSKYAKVEVNQAGITLCNNQVPEVTITGKNSDKSDQEKRIIVILARQHPGEVWSSYVAWGLMRGLLKDSPEVQYMLENYLIKFYPMVNVDGVIYGNFRCDVTGVDLNRRWKQPSRQLHPQIFDIKKKIISFAKKSRVDLCLDLHGHSKKYNIFCYACKHNAYTCRILPLLMQNQSHLFNMPSCTFGLTKDKETTARATISRIIHSQNVLTVQTSTFGWGTQNKAFHFTPLLLNKFSDQIIIAIRYFLDKKSSKFIATQRQIKEHFSKYKQYDQNNEEQSGSDSDPQQDEIDFKIKMATIFDKKYENQYKSFIKEVTPPSLHLSQIVFQEQNSPEPTLGEDNSPIVQKSLPQKVEYQREVFLPHHLSKEKVPERIPKNMKYQLKAPKKSISITPPEIGKDLQKKESKLPSSIQIKEKPKGVTKNIKIREKKRHSYIIDHNERETFINPSQTIQQEVGRVNLFREAQKEEEKRRIDTFINKFQRFIPATFNTKGKMESLEEDLERDDPSYQLHLMMENKKLLDKERIRRSIEDSTEIVERQGRVKLQSRKDPIVDFKRFKQNDKIKQQLKKLGEFSQRYLEGHY